MCTGYYIHCSPITLDPTVYSWSEHIFAKIYQTYIFTQKDIHMSTTLLEKQKQIFANILRNYKHFCDNSTVLLTENKSLSTIFATTGTTLSFCDMVTPQSTKMAFFGCLNPENPVRLPRQHVAPGTLPSQL